MQYEVLVKTVKEILAKTLNTIPAEEIHMTSKLKEDLGLDSMSSLTFLMALEDNINGFLVDPDTLDTSNLDNVESITQYVSSQLQRNLANVA